jgi:hypothetical protein
MSKPMTHKRLVSAFTKAGMIVTPMKRRAGNPGYSAKNPKTGEQVEWHTQAQFVYVKDGESYYDEANPVTSTVWSRHPDTDISTDLFMDSHYDTIKSAVQAIA